MLDIKVGLSNEMKVPVSVLTFTKDGKGCTSSTYPVKLNNDIACTGPVVYS